MPIKTEVKNSILSGILFLATVFAWVWGWIYFGMRWEFLTAPFMCALMQISCKYDDKTSGLIICGIIGLCLFIGIVVEALWFIVAIVAAAVCFAVPLVGEEVVIEVIDVGASRLNRYIRRLYSDFTNLPVKLSALMLPPFVLFLLVYLFSSIYRAASMSVAWLFYPLPSLLLMRLFNSSLLLFNQASENEKKRWNYISAYPQLICSRHFLKPSQIRKALFYHDVHCRAESCSQDEFITGIKQVTGVISVSTRNYCEDGRFYISLWSEKTKKAMNADIDILEIRDTKSISYDYAINAVLIELKNDASRPGGYVKQIPVIICGNPPIPEGAKAVLEHEFGKIETRR